MPHARPEEGAKGLGLSLLKLQRGVSFGADEFDPVDIIIMLWRRLISTVISK
ncbi:PTS family enzyme IIA, mannitol-specific, cryptic [Salmonella enterica subsp. enterica]|uniref:PTS family enzyme IIA, mannitol-specific, cryptic n=1 Tax=Salmonella enterica I TaxID=59201 RepID=A0A379VPU3_SALET|nr:PTS family enzyme IIA, mannitol-specific, cryptic [Salmonella enterica subsp. enterica]